MYQKWLKCAHGYFQIASLTGTLFFGFPGWCTDKLLQFPLFQQNWSCKAEGRALHRSHWSSLSPGASSGSIVQEKCPFPWEMCAHISPAHWKDNYKWQNKNLLYFFMQLLYVVPCFLLCPDASWPLLWFAFRIGQPADLQQLKFCFCWLQFQGSACSKPLHFLRPTS